jgi:hypothetical protein
MQDGVKSERRGIMVFRLAAAQISTPLATVAESRLSFGR